MFVIGMAKRIQRRSRKPAPPSMIGAALYFLDRGLAIGAIAVSVAIFFLLAGLISGNIPAFPRGPSGAELSPAAQEHFLHSVRLALYVFMAGMWGVTLVSVFRFRENDVAGYVGGVGGLLCYFALPWLVSASLMHHNANPNAASDLMLGGFRVTGKVLLLITAVYFAGKMVVRIANRPSRVRPATEAAAPVVTEGQPEQQVAKAPRRTLLRQCWELSLCRDNLRENCPSYKLHTTCWKRGTGCQCDPVLAQRLIQELELRLRGDLSENERVARERMKEHLSYRVVTHQGESYCRDCMIYNEHQYYKYRASYWIAYPITAGLILLFLPVITRAYHWLDDTIASMLSSLSMLPHSEEALRPFMRTVYNFNGEYIFITAIAIIIAAYLLDMVDYAVYHVKI